MIQPRPFATVALVAATTMFLAACNGSSKGSAAATSTSPTPQTVATTASQQLAIATSAPGVTAPAATTAAATSLAATTPAATTPPATTPPATTPPATTPPATSQAVTTAPAASAGGKCTDLSSAAASAALGKAVSITLDTSGTPLAGLTLCNVTIANEVYPVQLSVYTTNAAQAFAADKAAFAPTANVAGVGSQAFSSATGVEALAKGADIKVIGPAGPVLDNNFTVPTALAKAMAAALS